MEQHDEIRVHTESEHRLIYIAKYEKAVYVLQTFEKRTRKTTPRDLQLAKRRLADLVRARQAQ